MAAKDLYEKDFYKILGVDKKASADVAVPTASKILQPGYKYKERVLRPARVSVTDPVGG